MTLPANIKQLNIFWYWPKKPERQNDSLCKKLFKIVLYAECADKSLL